MDDNRRLLTKAQLRTARLKPAPGQEPASRYWQGMGWVYLYDAAGALPMRPYRAPTPAQRAALAAGRALVAGAVRPGTAAGRPHRAACDAECCRRVVMSLTGVAVC